MEFQRKYNVADDVYIPIIKVGEVNFAVGADWTPAAGDVKISKDGGAAVNIGTLPVAVVMGNAAMWKFVFTGTELSAKLIMITVSDAATKAIEDTMFDIITYGHASAQLLVDFADVMRGTDIGSLNDFDPANDDVAVVTLVGTTTVNTDMRGTDGVDTATMRGTDSASLASGVDVISLNGSTDAVDKLEAHALRTLPVTFDAGGTTTTAVFVNVDGVAASSTDDVYNGRILVFSAPAALKDQACTITDYDGSTLTATISQVTSAPIATAIAVMV